MIAQECRGTWRLQSSKFGDARGGHDGVSLNIHLEAIIQLTLKLYLSKLRAVLVGSNPGKLEMYMKVSLEVYIELS